TRIAAVGMNSLTFYPHEGDRLWHAFTILLQRADQFAVLIRSVKRRCPAISPFDIHFRRRVSEQRVFDAVVPTGWRQSTGKSAVRHPPDVQCPLHIAERRGPMAGQVAGSGVRVILLRFESRFFIWVGQSDRHWKLAAGIHDVIEYSFNFSVAAVEISLKYRPVFAQVDLNM